MEMENNTVELHSPISSTSLQQSMTDSEMELGLFSMPAGSRGVTHSPLVSLKTQIFSMKITCSSDI